MGWAGEVSRPTTVGDFYIIFIAFVDKNRDTYPSQVDFLIAKS